MVDGNLATFVVVAVTIVLLFNFFVGGLLIEYTGEFWLSFLKKTSVDIPFWVAGLFGIPLGGIAVPIAIATAILDGTDTIDDYRAGEEEITPPKQTKEKVTSPETKESNNND